MVTNPVASFFIKLAVIWGLVTAAGASYLIHYANAPGEPAAPPNFWPAGVETARKTGAFTLALFIHPHCHCSEATAEELKDIIARVGQDLDVKIFVFSPQNESAAWRQTSLWQEFTEINGAEVIADLGGHIAKNFGVKTSGQVILYRPDGSAAYVGGITSARGHTGDSLGKQAVISIVENRAPQRNIAAVFGCSLFNELKPSPKTQAYVH